MNPAPGQDQLTRFLSRLPAETDTGNDPTAPLAAFDTALVLDRDQEDAMVDHLMGRFHSLESELGRSMLDSDVGSEWFREGGTGSKTAAKSFFGRRQLYEMVYNNQVEWRETMLGGIYEEHNLCVPAARRVVQQQIARADNYFFGSEPWVTVFPIGNEDKDLADRVDRWVKHRFEQAGTLAAHKQANHGAFVRGEDVIKTTHRKEVDYHETIATVLLNEDGTPFIAQDNDYVFSDDVWIMDATTGKMVLKRDGATPLPPQAMLPDQTPNPEAFKQMKVPRTYTKWDSSESKVVYYMDFLCPLDAESVDDADCVVHTYSMPALDIATMLIDRVTQQPEVGKLPRILEILNSFGANGSEATSSRATRPRPEEGEESMSDLSATTSSDPLVNLGEFYCYYDPYGDGRGQRNIVVLIDLDNRVPIYYDYLANVAPECKRPFHVVRINPVPNRWHGSGNMETYWPLQEMIDLLANRWSEALSSSNRVDFWNPSAVYEGDEDPNLELAGGEAYTLKPGRHVEDALQVVYLNDIKSEKIHEQIQFLQQILTNMSGVANANDSRSAGLDTAQLATGINNIQASGEELFSPWLSHLSVGHKRAGRAAVLIEVEQMGDEETFHFFEGTQRKMAKVSRSELRFLHLDLRIEMTRFRTEKELIQSEKAYAVMYRFYGLPLELQAIWAAQSRRTLSNLETIAPEEIIREGYYSLLSIGMPPTPPTDTVGSGLGSGKPGVM